MSEATVRARRRRLPPLIAFVCVAYALGVTMIGTTLPTPLYPLYQQEFGFDNLMVTVIFAVYAVGVLAVLLLFGRASDLIGRRRVMLSALVASALSALIFLLPGGEPTLFAGRIVSGFSAGLAMGTGTAALVELLQPRYRQRASLVSTVVTMLGLGVGPLLAGLLAAHAPSPLKLPFAVHMGLLALGLLGLWWTPETVPVHSGAHLRVQRVSVPPQVRTIFLPAATAAFTAFAVFGLVAAIEPAILRTLMDQRSLAVAGAVVFVMFACSAVGQIATVRVPTIAALIGGCLVLVVGLIGVAGSLMVDSVALLTAGTAIVGIGHGAIFSAGMAAVIARSPADRRAEAASSFVIVAYVGISFPVVLVGIAIEVFGLRDAGVAFTIAAVVLALLAFAALIREYRGGQRHSTPNQVGESSSNRS